MTPKHSPYTRFSEDQLTLRDFLAVDRTIVANERTFLGYLRTGMALMVTGASLVNFFDSQALHLAGWIVGFAALPLTCLGGFHFFRRRADLRPLFPRNRS